MPVNFKNGISIDDAAMVMAYDLFRSRFKNHVTFFKTREDSNRFKDAIMNRYCEFPDWCRHDINRKNKSAIEFENGNRILFFVGTGKNVNMLRGLTINGLWVDSRCETTEFDQSILPALNARDSNSGYVLVDV